MVVCVVVASTCRRDPLCVGEARVVAVFLPEAELRSKGLILNALCNKTKHKHPVSLYFADNRDIMQ